MILLPEISNNDVRRNSEVSNELVEVATDCAHYRQADGRCAALILDLHSV